ncbi:MAG: excinuclease ABC subunit UvrC [Treponema sp.]|jgi:excinuclease ABC subunit C|nr:excinuclease ABC subunit UvrC [Treponema sp.]
MKQRERAERYATLKVIALDAPLEPGVYLWKDSGNSVIYIGKAKVLRNRLRSYFAGKKDAKTATLLKHAASIETIITTNEYEALLLENILIKQYMPRYNIALKDDKTYPLVRVSAERFPRIFKTRRVIKDGSHYFGPFPNSRAVDTLLTLVEKLYPLRKCQTLRKRKTPCMYYHIGRCCGPCCGRINEVDYETVIRCAIRFFSGDMEALIIDLTVQMHQEAGALHFEKAVDFRDAIVAIESLSPENAVLDFDPESRDYIAWASEGTLTTFTVFSFRDGKMRGRELFRTHSAAPDEESLETFVAAYYTPERPPPAQIFIQKSGQESSAPSHTLLQNWFTKTFSRAPALLAPSEKRHEAVLAMARQNALDDLRRQLKERGAGPALDELAQALGLHSRPVHIEGFDIAQLDGKHPVASLISFRNGVPDKKNYRAFKLRTVVGVVDDFAAVREVVRRRYSRLLQEDAELPDLILIDGGIGQVNAAKGVLDELGISCDLVGLAKREEELYLPHTTEPIRLPQRSDGLKVLQFVRDETHRFATTLNQKLRSKDLAFSRLETVKGVGPKKAATLMKRYRSLVSIAAASVADLRATAALNEHTALAIKAAVSEALSAQNKPPQARGRGDGNAGKSLALLAMEDSAAESTVAETPPSYRDAP